MCPVRSASDRYLSRTNLGTRPRYLSRVPGGRHLCPREISGDACLKELRDTPVKVNAANPGYTATDLNRHTGFRSVAEGAEASVHLATLPAEGPSGILWGHLWTADADAYGPLPW